MIRYVHDNCGHYAVQNLFHTLAARYFWKSLFADTTKYCETCAVCKRVKVNFKHRYAPLHPLPVPDYLESKMTIDHKILTRKTTAGNTAVLVVVEYFSGYSHLIPVQVTTAKTTACALLRYVIPRWGLDFELYSDKGPAFTSALFANIKNLLGLRHVTSAFVTARSNGQAKSIVKSLVEHLKIHAKDDLCIEECIPLIEICLRAIANSKLLLSPYEIVFGRCFRLGVSGDPKITLPDVEPNKIAYYRWLSTKLKRLHEAVRTNRAELKIEEKLMYDKAHKAAMPDWQVNDRVLLKDTRVRPGVLKVVTRQRFFGPYIMKDVIKERPDVGVAYQLVEEETGKVLKNLVTNDRLKRYNVDRTSFNQRLPRWQNFKTPDQELKRQNAQNPADEQPRPLRIVKQKMIDG